MGVAVAAEEEEKGMDKEGKQQQNEGVGVEANDPRAGTCVHANKRG